MEKVQEGRGCEAPALQAQFGDKTVVQAHELWFLGDSVDVDEMQQDTAAVQGKHWV